MSMLFRLSLMLFNIFAISSIMIVKFAELLIMMRYISNTEDNALR